ncbi:hypothetical protein [Desulfobacula toluolica]|uniref:hypothetical protein n=1 Tax=Desulfobacula toluolica TaxID=28223 RepID=UPI00059D36E9|nr:hypothetical protein [Desulfobacula toluolica]
MYPEIITFIHLGHLFLIVNYALVIFNNFNPERILSSSGIFIIMIAISAYTMLLLKELNPWSRIISIIIFGLHSVVVIATVVFFSILMHDFSVIVLGIPSIPLLFLTYKVYSSKPLKIYLYLILGPAFEFHSPHRPRNK